MSPGLKCLINCQTRPKGKMITQTKETRQRSVVMENWKSGTHGLRPDNTLYFFCIFNTTGPQLV